MPKTLPARQFTKRSLKSAQCEILRDLKPIETRISSVTTGWKVQWTIEEIVRDLWQNFYDGNRDWLDRIEVKIDGMITEVFGPAPMDLDAAFYLGSSKSLEDGDIGYFGEGLKVASLCLLRDFNAGLVLASGAMAVRILIAGEANSQGLRPLTYCYFRLPPDSFVDGTKLIVENCSKPMREAFKNASLNFWSPEHPRLGKVIAGQVDSLCVCETSDGEPGAVFYRKLKRADLDVPLFIAVDKPFSALERLVQRDRDRNAFGPELLDTFFKLVCKSRIFQYGDASQRILLVLKDHWESGHPLLRALLTTRWSGLTNNFNDQYFASRGTRLLPLSFEEEIAVRDIESMWEQSGRRKLPAYFNNAGVPNALDEFNKTQREIRDEAERELRAKRRGPTQAEQACIALLEESIFDLDASFATVVLRGARYLIADTHQILGAWQRTREYKSREIYFSAKLFSGPFNTGFATYLHECSHLFGHDGSRGFTDALTQLIESLADRPYQLAKYKLRWDELCKTVLRERRLDSPVNDDVQKRASSVLEELSNLPLSVAQSVISNYQAERETTLASLIPSMHSNVPLEEFISNEITAHHD